MTDLTPERKAKFEQVAQNRLSGVILVLENIYDPHNAAAIMRSAESLGIQEMWLICETVERWNPQITGKRSSGRAHKWLDFRLFETSKEAIIELKKQNYRLYGTLLDEEASSLDQTDFTKDPKIALIMGNEHDGLSPIMQRNLDRKIYIPMKGFTESYNVSVACALCLWEISSQRGGAGMTPNAEEQKALIETFKSKKKLRQLRIEARGEKSEPK